MLHIPSTILSYCFTLSLLGGAVHAIDSSEYEYVIIGSGPGGGPLGANLARKGHSVLVIEAGEDHGNSPLQVIPALADVAAEDPTMSWEFFVSYHSDPVVAQQNSKYTWRMTNGSFYVGTDPPADAEPLGIYYPRVGTLGGCGQHNAMNLALPPDNDWESIADLTSDDSWRAANMRHLFERVEKCNYMPEGTPGHGFSGWLEAWSNQNNVSLFAPNEGFISVVRAGMIAAGQAQDPSDEEVIDIMLRDMNRADPKRYEEEGMYQLPLHVDDQRQRSSAYTYLNDTISEVNEDGSQKYPLTISTSSLATKVLFSNVNSGYLQPKAIGVEYLKGQALYKADRRFNESDTGTRMTAYASEEVIVAGGAFNTPQILKLSGVGPKEELEKFNIPVVADIPAVGMNLQDNYEGGVESLASADFMNLFENCTFLSTPEDPCLVEYEATRSGPYSLGAAPIGMLMRSSLSENEDSDLFFFGASASIFRGYYPGFSRASAPDNLFWWSIVKMQSQNRAGTVKLRSANPRDVPEINFNFFQEGGDHDLSAMAEGVEFSRRMFNQTEEPYSPFQETVPGRKDIKENLFRESFSHHAAGSCAIGTDKETSCVDSRFRVHGISNLRVVDASVFPRAPGGFPILPTFLVSEKATDVILEDNSA